MNPIDRFSLDDKVVVITGASSGLGLGFARAMAAAGATLVLAARREDRLEVVPRRRRPGHRRSRLGFRPWHGMQHLDQDHFPISEVEIADDVRAALAALLSVPRR